MLKSKFLSRTVFLSIGLSIFSQVFASTNTHQPVEAHVSQLNTLQIPFVENRGQINNPSVRFFAKTLGGTLFVTDKGDLVYKLPPAPTADTKQKNGEKAQGWVIREQLVNHNQIQVKSEDFMDAKIHSFIGNDKNQWATNQSTMRTVSLGEVYDDIELKLRAYGTNVEKLFYVNPNANPENIRLKIEGGKNLSVNKAGELVVGTDLGDIRFTKPIAYQEENGIREYVRVAYNVSDNQYGFTLGKYDSSKTLVIDPFLASTYLGVGGRAALESVSKSVFDMKYLAGNLYVAGSTSSPSFPDALGAYTAYQGGLDDGFIMKVSADLSTLHAFTYFGASAQEWITGLALDGNQVYVVGWANSSGLPTTPGAYREIGSGVFVARFSDDLGTLVASTYVGTSNSDFPYDITVAGGSVGIAGRTASSTYPTTAGAYKTTCCEPSGSFGLRSSDAFVSKLDTSLTNLQASTYIGGGGGSTPYERADTVAIDATGNVYITAQSLGGYPTTSGAYIEQTGGSSAAITKFDPQLSTLVASTLLRGSGSGKGSSSGTFIYDMKLDNGTVVVTGSTNEPDFPTTANAYDTQCGSDGQCDLAFVNTVDITYHDVFVARLSGSLDTLLASTFLGGSGHDYGRKLVLNGVGEIIVAGETKAADFPMLPNSIDNSANGDVDVVIFKLDSNLQSLIGSTYLGGENEDGVGDVAVDEQNNIYVAGTTLSSQFPTTSGAYNQSFSSSGTASNTFVAKYDANLSDGSGDLADLSVSMTDSVDPVLKGDLLTYAINVSNSGPMDATSVTLTDTLPKDITFESVTSSQGSCTTVTKQGKGKSKNTIITTGVDCGLGVMAVGTVASVQITVRLNAAGTNTNSVSISANENDPNLSNNSASETTTVNDPDGGSGKPCKGKKCR